MSDRESRRGLVLSGGGARAAYQVGAIQALAEIVGERTPFRICTGVSAGAINAVSVASHADDFRFGAEKLRNLWSALTPECIYRTDALSLGSIGTRLLSELTSGGLRAGHANHLLDTSPLCDLLESNVTFSTIQDALRKSTLRGVAVSATNYHTGTAVTFYAREPVPVPAIHPWVRSMRLGVETSLGLEHVLASSAIPVFFPPVKIDGAYFGDGCVRLNSPISPAVHLGADRIVAIGVRHVRSTERTMELNQEIHPSAPSLSEIGGVLLNAVFLDSLEGDVERLERINRTIVLVPESERLRAGSLRQIPILVLRPSEDLGALAENQHERFPRVLRYLLRGIGVTRERGSDLLSYLAFLPAYIGRLLDLGYRDTVARKSEVEAFFSGT